jgi:hypothetical protein
MLLDFYALKGLTFETQYTFEERIEVWFQSLPDGCRFRENAGGRTSIKNCFLIRKTVFLIVCDNLW